MTVQILCFPLEVVEPVGVLDVKFCDGSHAFSSFFEMMGVLPDTVRHYDFDTVKQEKSIFFSIFFDFFRSTAEKCPLLYDIVEAERINALFSDGNW